MVVIEGEEYAPLASDHRSFWTDQALIVRFQQEIETAGRRRHRIRSANAGVAMAQAETADARRRLRLAVGRTYSALALVQARAGRTDVRRRRPAAPVGAEGDRPTVPRYDAASAAGGRDMRGRLTAAVVLVVIAGGTAAVAQRGWRGGWSRMPPKFPVAAPEHRAFTFSRILYDSDRREPGGQGWYTDYPTADQNLMIRLSELTTTSVGFDEHDEPDHVVVRLTDEALFNYPFIFMSDVGTLWLDDIEAQRLGQYLRKGGFLWVDDFWGPWAWEQWIGEIAKALPAAEYPIFDITPDHPLRHGMFEVPEIPQIPSIQHWRRSGGATTSERGSRSHEVHFRGIADKAGRLMVLMSHNTDIADGWEREGEDYEFFYRFSINAYAVGINTVVHAMTH